MRKPSVTILVTIKNTRDTIKRCIESLLKLNYPNKKIHVIDAFSNDGTYEILKKFGKKIKLEQLKGNPPRAYNYALKKIKTDFVAFTDGDCVVDKNWLKMLVSGFTSSKILAVGGFCKTPKNSDRLQKIIGIELENRFKRFSKFVSRLPTMNLCVRTKVAKRLLFDEQLSVAYDTDFGYRLNKIGKMVYEPKAIVYHHHRASWRGFLKQQFTYGKFVPLLYFKHKERSYGDHISKPSMGLQLLLFSMGCLCFILSFINSFFIFLASILFIFLILLYVIDILRISKKLSDFPLFFIMFLTRTVAWTLGLIFSIPIILRRRK